MERISNMTSLKDIPDGGYTNKNEFVQFLGYSMQLANNKKYTTAKVHTTKSNWNLETIDVSKITRLEVLDNGKYVTCRLVVKEPSNADSISTILGISGEQL